MHLKKTLLAAALLAAVPYPAMAANPSGHLEAYYLDSSLELEADDTVDFDGDGFGIRGDARVGENAFAFGEFQHAEYDRVGPVELNIEQIRFGLGYLFSRSEPLDFYGKLSYLNLELDSNVADAEDNGWAAHAGIAFRPSGTISLFGEIGYVDVSDLSGPEYSIGASFDVTGRFGIVAGCRLSDLESDDDTGLNLRDLQLGIRLGF